MSTIDKLAIQGIRAFSPFEEQKIEFFLPLTLILGQNGAGKTTIIECLKAMVSGAMPPNTNKGKTFIHDPKVSNASETKAVIKCKFKSHGQKEIFALRSYQLLNKKDKKQEFKKMEQLLKGRDKNGREVSINKNCAEMDRQVPMLLGVSNSILENVIFCHQEESLWPFSDQANLKKIFDEIFETTKYTKALTELRDLKKQFNSFAKDYKNQLDVMKKDFEIYRKLKEDEKREKALYQENHQICEKYRKQIQTLSEELEDIEKFEDNLRKIENQIFQEKSILSNMIPEYDKICKSLGVDAIDDPSLNETDDFKKKQDEMLEKKNKELQKAEGDMKRLRENQSKMIGEKGTLQGSLNHKKERLAKINKALMKNLEIIFKELQERFSDPYRVKSLLTGSNGKGAFLLISKEVNGFTDERKQILREYEEQAKGLENQVQVLEKHLAEIRIKIDLKNQDLVKLKDKHNVMKEDEALGNENTAELKIIDTRLDEIRKELEETGADVASMQYSEENFSTPKKIRSTVKNMETLSEQKRAVLTDMEEMEKELEEKQGIVKLLGKIKDTEDRKLELEKTYTENIEKVASKLKSFSKVIMKRNKNNNMAAVEEIIKDTKTKIACLHQEKNELVRKQIHSENDAKTLKDHLKYLEEKKEHLSEEVTKLASSTLDIEVDTYSDLIEAKNDETLSCVYDRLIKKKASSNSTRFDDFSKYLTDYCHEEKKCYLCKKEMKKSKAKTIPKLLKEYQEKSSESSDEENEDLIDDKILLCGKIKYIMNELIVDIETDIEKTKAKIGDMSQPTTEEDILFKEKEISEVEEKLESLSQIKAEIQQNESFKLDLRRNDAALEGFQTQLKENGYEGYIEDDYKTLQSELSKKKGEFKQLENEYDSQRQERDRVQKLVTNLQFEAHNLKEKKLKITQIKASLVESMNTMRALEKDIQNLESDIGSKINEEKDLAEQIENLQNSNETSISPIQGKKNKADIIWNSIEKPFFDCSRLIEAIDNEAIDEDEIEKVHEMINKLEKDLKSESVDLVEKEKLIEVIKKDILQIPSSNKKIELLRKGRELLTEIERIKESLANKCKYEEEINQSKEKKRQVLKSLDELKTRYNMTAGSNQQLEKNIKSTKLQLHSRTYDNITKRITQLEIRHSLTKLMTQEISEKHDVTEDALRMYHHSKMKEINETIENFWKLTYKGDDIETIEIKSDQDEEKSNRRLRSYNYRIVLKKKNGAELDMRGRCSAGQKVLSSIIIRIALAETFCSNCGILALDEPTTNLDKENIVGLVENLQILINERKSDTNFQLIIITHDNEFLNLLGGEYCEKYWEVTKDRDGYSKIKKEDLKKLT
ncbi:unnamed protein product [Moneuplotes crassus]|uniref:DNA repair protein RAD50 n=1 Tax=Euplotes crassus TaxID=5936 RepID=A0AAD1UE73_EUPCR|nr:unnamed protein product [Moneuplotes crassus]